MTSYPELVRVYGWTRRHPGVADAAFGLLLLAASSGQLESSPASAGLAVATVNAAFALAVAWRRRDMLLAFGMVAAIGLAQAAFGFRPGGAPPVRALEPTPTDVAIVVLLYTLAVYRPRRESLAGLALCLVGSGVAIFGWTPAQHSLSLLLVASVALGATFAGTWVLGDSVAYRRSYYVSLEERLAAAERARDLERKRAQAVEESAARLRRIERDLHDGAQVRLAALAMTLGEAKETLADDPEGAAGLVRSAHQAAKDTLTELRQLARGIHPPVLDRGLDAALRSLADSSAVPVRLDVVLAGRSSPAIEAIVYFSAAELLANAVKHSGASTAAVTVRAGVPGILLTVADDGSGGARVTEGGGLAGLRDRVRTVDGSLAVHSPAGGPTAITIELPGRA